VPMPVRSSLGLPFSRTKRSKSWYSFTKKSNDQRITDPGPNGTGIFLADFGQKENRNIKIVERCTRNNYPA
jgi:hypothetical protein